MDFSKLDALMDSMPLRGLPACALEVTHHGKTVYSRVSGNANDDTLWWIYSASKISTCVAAMQLVEQGRIFLDDPVSKYIPSFKDMKVASENGPVPCDTEMKIIHLFTMTGGLDYSMDEPEVKAAYQGHADTVGVVSAMGSKVLLFKPGEHYRYSLCHDVLGAVVSAVSGMPLGEYLKKNLWLPLGMTETGFTPSEEQKTRIADMFMFDHSTGTAIPYERTPRVYENPNYESGGGGVFSRAKDYVKLMTALSLGGVSPEGARILKPETVKELQVNRLSAQCMKDLWHERLYGYGWGLCGRVHINPDYSISRSSKGEFGWDGAAAAYALADPEKEIALYFGTHVHGCNYCYCWVHPKIRDMVYEAIEG